MGIPREPLRSKLGGLRRDYTPTPQITKAYNEVSSLSNNITKAYLFGVLHDATERRTTYRISTNNQAFSELLKEGIKKLKSGAWIYKEGKNRNLWIIEFPKSLLKNFKIKSDPEKINYVRGYFDAEGGVAKTNNVRYYISFSQKNKDDLSEVKDILEEFGIACGVIHNPSKKVDPDYWRFFVRAKSYLDFVKKIGSFHPLKGEYLRMKI